MTYRPPYMDQRFIDRLYQHHINTPEIPPPRMVYRFVDELLELLFPEFSDVRYASFREFENQFQALRIQLNQILQLLQTKLHRTPLEVENAIMQRVELAHQLLLKDANAICSGDPAAVDVTEVIRTYPGFYALAIHRLAHVFYGLEVPLIPRILSEYAHQKTGIDIHPGATIGENFCIDHGTGLVIGETVEIGDDVKIYHGVTLGALSVAKKYAQTKRHPTIEDRVVIYSGATILGGQTVIGADSIIGGNVWLTKSVPAGSRLYYQASVREV